MDKSRNPSPNGGEVKPLPVGMGRMKDRTIRTPITHTPLPVPNRNDVHRGDVDTNERMPKQHGGAPQTEPRRR